MVVSLWAFVCMDDELLLIQTAAQILMQFIYCICLSNPLHGPKSTVLEQQRLQSGCMYFAAGKQPFTPHSPHTEAEHEYEMYTDGMTWCLSS